MQVHDLLTLKAMLAADEEMGVVLTPCLANVKPVDKLFYCRSCASSRGWVAELFVWYVVQVIHFSEVPDFVQCVGCKLHNMQKIVGDRRANI